MTIKKRKTSCRFLLVIILLYTFWVQSQEKAVDTSNNNLNATLSNAKKIRYQNPEKALIVLQEVHDQALVYGDTLLAINALLEMLYIYGQQVNYA